MPGKFPIIIAAIVGVVVLVVFAIVAAVLADKRRRAGMEQVAAEMGMDYREQADGLPMISGSRLPLFQRGRRGRCRSVMSGRVEDIELWIFDFLYTISTGKSQTTVAQTVAAFRFQGRELPIFALTPESFFHRIGEALGMKDFDFPEHPLFSKMYRLTGDDEAAVRACFNEDLVRHLESVEKRLNVEADRGWLIVYRGGKRAKPEAVSAFLDEAFAVANRVA